MAQILIVDDEQPLLQSLSLDLRRVGHECLTATNGRQCLDLLERNSPALAIVDIQLPDLSGLDLLRRLRADLPEVPVVIITAYSSVDSAVEAMKEGAVDYLEKPLDLEELQLVVERELKNARLSSEVEAYRRDSRRGSDVDQMIGHSAALEKIRATVQRISSVPVEKASELPTVLILGETGVGKDLLARHIHYSGPLANRPFVQINCSGLPRELVESELFGHEKGAFTSAAQRKQGLFEVANGGTIFLDEIGDMALDIQAKLLNVIEHRRARRVGGTRDHIADVRIIAATNRDLGAAVAEGAFRSDLYFRLKVVSLVVPPLRHRTEDIPALAEFFLKKYRAKYRKPNLVLNESVLTELLEWHWPGNVRELAHTLEHMVLVSDEPHLARPPFAASVDSAEGVPTATPAVARPSASTPTPLGERAFDFATADCSLVSVEKKLILEALAFTGRNVSEVARLLGVSRGALRHRMEKWGIEA
ncbi:MAG: sigma-54-dependent transcriptional regulator [Planctomycetota bacterium]